MGIRALMDTLRLGYWTAFTGAKAPGRVNAEELTLDSLQCRHFWAKDSKNPLVVLHGLTRKGYNDLRLNHFCRVMALLGYEVFAPNLETLQNLDFSTDDVERIVQMIQAASSRSGSEVGLMGFSFGAGYGLLAAADPSVSNKISFVLAVDGYSSLDRVVGFTYSEACTDPYGRLCLAWVCRKELGLSKEQLNEYEDLMNNYCVRETNFTPQDRQITALFLESKYQDAVEVRWRGAYHEMQDLEVENNPILAKIQAKTYLMHNAQDTLMPVDETLGIYKTLKAHDRPVWISISKASGHLNYLKGDLIGPVNIFYRILCLR